MLRALALALLVLVPAPSALAQTGVLADAASGLRASSVYVDPSAERAITDAEAVRLRERIVERDAGPLYMAILPGSALDAAGGDPDAALVRLAEAVGEPGTYVLLAGGSLRAGATRGILRGQQAGRLASAALDAQRADGTMAVLLDLVDRIGAARNGEGTGGTGGAIGAGALVPLLLLLGVPALLVFSGRRKRRRAEAAELEDVKAFAEDDLVALGDDIRSLDLDIEMPGVPQAAKDEYSRALDRYERADRAWRSARHANELEEVGSLVEDGRHAVAAAKALIEGRPVPERRPPCFFDPRHGPSVEDAEWAPPGGQVRPVPVCAADAARIADGVDPSPRTVGGVPYWDAGPAYAPYAAGFFGGGLLPGLFVGSMLGGMMFPGPVFGGGFGGDGGDAGLGGDFGGGGMDFGGGDFGGGDFGGGGDF